MILICLGINPVGDCSEMAVLGFRSSLLVINQVLRIIKMRLKVISKLAEGCSICIPVIRNTIVRLHVIFNNQYDCHFNLSNLLHYIMAFIEAIASSG